MFVGSEKACVSQAENSFTIYGKLLLRRKGILMKLYFGNMVLHLFSQICRNIRYRMCDDGQTEAVCESVAAVSLYELTSLLWAAGTMCVCGGSVEWIISVSPSQVACKGLKAHKHMCTQPCSHAQCAFKKEHAQMRACVYTSHARQRLAERRLFDICNWLQYITSYIYL